MAIIQRNKTTPEGQASLITRILHKNGEFVEDEGVPIRSKDPNDPQKIGSAITYARRYGLQSILGMVGVEDDDANLVIEVEEEERKKDKKTYDQLEFEYDYNISDDQVAPI